MDLQGVSRLLVHSSANDAPHSFGQPHVGGREHPKLQGLSEATKLLLSLGRPVMRKIVLGKGNRADLPAGLVGNTILLAQPTTAGI